MGHANRRIKSQSLIKRLSLLFGGEGEIRTSSQIGNRMLLMPHGTKHRPNADVEASFVPRAGIKNSFEHIPPRADIASGRRHCPMSSPRRFPPPARQRAALVGQVLTKTSTIYFVDKTPSHFRNLRKCSAKPRSQRLLGRFNEQGSAVHHLCARRNGCHSRLILCARLWGPGGCLRRAAPWSRIRARHTAIPPGSARPAIRPTSRRAAIRGISTRGPIRGISRDAAIRPTSHRPIWSASRRVLIAPIDR